MHAQDARKQSQPEKQGGPVVRGCVVWNGIDESGFSYSFGLIQAHSGHPQRGLSAPEVKPLS